MHLALLEKKNRETNQVKYNQAELEETFSFSLSMISFLECQIKYFNVIFRRKHIYFFLNAFFISVVELCRNKQLTISSVLSCLQVVAGLEGRLTVV